MTDPSLFERAGGEPTISAAIALFYEKILTDKILNPFFAQNKIASQQTKQQSYLSMALGGGTRYEGKSLREAHVHLLDQGLSEEHFSSASRYIKASLIELQLDQVLISEIMTIVASTHDDILNI